MDESNKPAAERMPQIIGRYQVQASVGFGAMGAVYKAFDPLIKRTLAIKTIRLDIPKQSPQYKSFLERFYHEARISGTLSHPNIVTLFDIGEEGGSPFLAMEFVEGDTIGSMVERGTKFDPERVIGLISQIAAAIDYAHSRGVIHRDIKPSNLILSEGDRVKVTDFGIAKLVDAEMTQSGQLLGTPSYMSPEQAMGDKLDGRSDIFSLGICAFEMLSGEQPFPGTNVTSILYKLVHLPPVEPPNLEMNGLVPQKWHEVFGRVLAKKPDERYQTASAFVQDLELCLGSWFGSAMGEDGAPATLIMSASGVAAAAAAARAATPAPASVPDVTAAIPAPKPAAAAAPAAAAEEPEAATVLMKAAPVVAPPRPASAPADDDAENATRQYSVPDLPPAPVNKPSTPSKKAPVPPQTQALPRPELATKAPAPPAATPVPVSAPPPAPAKSAAPSSPRKSGSAMPLILGGLAFFFLLVIGGGILLVMKLRHPAEPQPVDNPPPTVTDAPVAHKTAAVPAAPATIVRVSSDPPGAMIFVDDDAKGLTPLDVSGIPLGAHEVRLELSGYDTKNQAIQLTADAPQAEVALTLATPAPAAPVMSAADITSTPDGAAVMSGRRSLGTTPLRELKLKVGSYRLELRKEGYEPYPATLVVKAGETAKLSATLKAEVVKATATPEPPKDVVDPNRIYLPAEVDLLPKRMAGPISPTYPDSAPKLKSGEKVSVGVSWVVTDTGEITEIAIMQSAGKAIDDAVMKMLKNQRWEPGAKKGIKVKVRLEGIYSFRSG